MRRSTKRRCIRTPRRCSPRLRSSRRAEGDARPDRARGRRPEPGESSFGLPVQNTLLEGTGDLRTGRARADPPCGRVTTRRVPLAEVSNPLALTDRRPQPRPATTRRRRGVSDRPTMPRTIVVALVAAAAVLAACAEEAARRRWRIRALGGLDPRPGRLRPREDHHRAQSKDDLLARMDEAADAIDDAVRDLEDVGAQSGSTRI